MVDGWATFGIEKPFYTSQGQWTLTGNQGIAAFMPLKRATVLNSGLVGVSGIAWVRQYATIYNDISGISGCIGVNVNALLADSQTGIANTNRVFARRNLAVLHMGIVKLPYVSGTLDGTVKTLLWGDLLAPCISGFRVWEQINYTGISGSQGNNLVNVLHTGVRQQKFGVYMDYPSSQTGTSGAAIKRIWMCPEAINGVTK